MVYFSVMRKLLLASRRHCGPDTKVVVLVAATGKMTPTENKTRFGFGVVLPVTRICIKTVNTLALRGVCWLFKYLLSRYFTYAKPFCWSGNKIILLKSVQLFPKLRGDQLRFHSAKELQEVSAGGKLKNVMY